MQKLQIKTGDTAMWSFSNNDGETIFGSGTFAGVASRVKNAYGEEITDPHFNNLAIMQTSQRTLFVPIDSLRIPVNGSPG